MDKGDTPASIADLGVDHRQELRLQRHAAIAADEWRLSPGLSATFAPLAAAWERLDPDPHFGGGQRATRTRRYSDFDYTPDSGELAPRTHVAYLQSMEMNAFVGGMERHFGDVEPQTYTNALFRALVRYDFDSLPIGPEHRSRIWRCQIHQIRITIHPGQIYDVVPEGIHSDGYPFAALHLIARVNVAGGESSLRTWDEEELLAKTTFRKPLDTLIFEDRRMKHYTTPISAPRAGEGHRDVLAVSFSLPNSPYEILV
ncbi:2OG-Fe dioxygenase family protein [Streptomyces sp. NPDC050636]|uniref:2OG-Fe dioxygenase family protein n=1 Tax=Streptomyces sp. NPDC050636 TaxID=3154510 RepID=UPI0034139B24